MKYIYTLLTLFVGYSTSAQTADSAITLGGQYEIYYDLKSGTQTSVDVSDWEIGFTTAAFDVSIMINEAGGVELFAYSNDTSNWSSVDTNGFDFESNKLFNSTETWDLGAFCNMGTAHPDYGWGMYNMSNHELNGLRIFLLKKGNGQFRQVVVTKMSSAGVFTVKIGELGGANTSYVQLDKADFQTKNFFYLNTDDRTAEDLEPSDVWHLLFTKYVAPIQAGPQTLYYPVSGVKINKDLIVAKRTGVAVESDDTSGLMWTSNITEIGYDWKSFNNQTFQYDIAEDQTYFIKDTEGNLFKIWFTNYKGGATGGFYFNAVSPQASIDDADKIGLNVYPNPSHGKVYINNSLSGLYTLNIYNLQGVLISSQELNAQVNGLVDLNLTQSGLYLLEIKTETSRYIKRIILE